MRIHDFDRKVMKVLMQGLNTLIDMVIYSQELFHIPLSSRAVLMRVSKNTRKEVHVVLYF